MRSCNPNTIDTTIGCYYSPAVKAWGKTVVNGKVYNYTTDGLCPNGLWVNASSGKYLINDSTNWIVEDEDSNKIWACSGATYNVGTGFTQQTVPAVSLGRNVYWSCSSIRSGCPTGWKTALQAETGGIPTDCTTSWGGGSYGLSQFSTVFSGINHSYYGWEASLREYWRVMCSHKIDE